MPSRPRHLRVLGLIALSWSLSGPVLADRPELVLDGLSFFSFAGSKEAALLPAGTRIGVTFERVGEETWSVTIAPGALAVPPVTYPSGLAVEWRLEGPARGTFVRDGSSLRGSITAPLVAHVGGSAEGIPIPLTFTTEVARRDAKDLVAEREGMRLDPRSGYIQMVAAGVNPAHAATAPGEPFVAVLSGTFEKLPKELTAAP